MRIGQTVLAKVDGLIKECIVEKIGYEDLILKLEDKVISRKFWEVRKIEKNKE